MYIFQPHLYFSATPNFDNYRRQDHTFPHRNNTGEGIKENEYIHGNIITHYIPKE